VILDDLTSRHVAECQASTQSFRGQATSAMGMSIEWSVPGRTGRDCGQTQVETHSPRLNGRMIVDLANNISRIAQTLQI
jgi:hypothetical protein